LRLALAAVLFFAATAPALAQTLSAREAKQIFYGFDMMGVVEGTDVSWRECIRPNGKTSYWHDQDYQQGTLRIRDDGVLCFSYPDPQTGTEACWHAERLSGSNWRFVSVDGGATVFVTKQTRKAKSCPDNNAPIS
jgi:hypothetical protein